MTRKSWTLQLKPEKVYILPTSHGLVILATVVIMILVGATYGNNLVNTLAFLLFSVLLVSMVQTHANLRGIKIQSIHCSDAFAGSDVQVGVRIENVNKVFSHNIWLEAKELGVRVRTDGIGAGETQTLSIFLPTQERGRYPVPRLRIFTKYPLGLFVAWSIQKEELVYYYLYPKPSGLLQLPQKTTRFGEERGQGHGDSSLQPGIEEFFEFSRYHLGDSIRRIDWRVSERIGRLVLRSYKGEEGGSLRISLADTKGSDIEERLSQLSHWIVQAQRKKVKFELHVPQSSPISSGDKGDVTIALRALAVFDREVA
jgi:uncharacterized protein (DUF58 family)